MYKYFNKYTDLKRSFLWKIWLALLIAVTVAFSQCETNTAIIRCIIMPFFLLLAGYFVQLILEIIKLEKLSKITNNDSKISHKIICIKAMYELAVLVSFICVVLLYRKIMLINTNLVIPLKETILLACLVYFIIEGISVFLKSSMKTKEKRSTDKSTYDTK